MADNGLFSYDEAKAFAKTCSISLALLAAKTLPFKILIRTPSMVLRESPSLLALKTHSFLN